LGGFRSASPCRVIPAWAGNRRNRSSGACPTPGHPRVGGEQVVHRADPHDDLGSSPRGRGTDFTTGQQSALCRVIPAWAGNSLSRITSLPASPGHPRVGGEQGGCNSPPCVETGSSPRGRGTGSRDEARITNNRVIPAWAGNRQQGESRINQQSGHPRVGGEQISPMREQVELTGSSPRGRGTVAHLASRPIGERVIPAWAGNRDTIRRKRTWITGHPRVGGEQVVPHRIIYAGFGSSPRGRGTVSMNERRAFTRRVIPAWAGNSVPRLPP